jgi:glutathione S-transferase
MHSSFNALRNEAPMNCRKHFPGYQLSEQALADIERIQSIWRFCRQKFGHHGPWLFGEFSIADAMYAPVVMRFRSFDVSLDGSAQSYCQTVNDSASIKRWISNGLNESDLVSEDELDHPSVLLTS